MKEINNSFKQPPSKIITKFYSYLINLSHIGLSHIYIFIYIDICYIHMYIISPILDFKNRYHFLYFLYPSKPTPRTKKELAGKNTFQALKHVPKETHFKGHSF